MIEVFSTGGGITLAEKKVDVGIYAVVSSEAPEYMTMYRNQQTEERYLPEDMIFSTHCSDITVDYRVLYQELRDALTE